MRTSLLLSMGLVLGLTVSYVLTDLFNALDEGLTQTYRCDQLAREADALNSAREIIQQYLELETLADLETAISAAGLEMMLFDKGDHIVVVVGHEPATMALEFHISQTGEVDLHSFPGSRPCTPSTSE